RDRHFDGTLVAYAAFDLAADRLAYDLGIQLRAADLHNVDLHIVVTGQLLQFFFDPVYFLATFTDDDTRFGSMDGDDQFSKCTLDNDTGYTAFIDTCIKISADF